MSRSPRSRRRFRPLCEGLETRFLPATSFSGGAWVINGDADRMRPGDRIVVRPDPRNAASLQAVVNGRVVDSQPASAVVSIDVRAGFGDDSVRISLPDALKRIPARIHGGVGNDRLFGGPGNDYIDGGAGSDYIEGGGGDDIILGGAGNDVILGGAGNDKINGGAGNDRVEGGSGDDNLDGAAGANFLVAGTGRNNLVGHGRDRLVSQPAFDHLIAEPQDEVVTTGPSNPLRHLTTEADLRAWLLDQADKQWAYTFGMHLFTYDYGGGIRVPITEGDVVPLAAYSTNVARSSGPSASPSTDHSTTNTQVAGVDEADLVKTDGSYLYLTSGNQVVIISAGDPVNGTDPSIVSRTKFDGSPVGLYLDGDRLTVLSYVYNAYPRPWPGGPIFARPMGIAYMPIYWQPRLMLTVLDVSDRANPKKVEENTLDGNLISSRDVDGKVYLVLQNSSWLPAPLVVADEKGGQRYETRDEYRARLAADDALTKSLPGYTTIVSGASGDDTTTGTLISAGLYIPKHPSGDSVLSILSFDVTNDKPGPEAITSAVGVAGEVYSTADHLYVAATNWTFAEEDGVQTSQVQTDIYRFDLSIDSIDLAATGSVPGWVVNNFAMDESGGNFRIATTTSTGKISNNVFVLKADEGTFDVVGSLTGLTPTERIYSARFLGDRLYLSTFRQIDPLLTIDLSDPTAPTVTGLLEIPGYSSYLHPADETHLIGLGRDSDPATGRTLGLALTLFDVSDPSHPVSVDKYVFAGDPWSSSTAAEWDHHAFSYFGDQGILALPVQTGSWWKSENGLAVFDVDLAKGFTSLGQVKLDSVAQRSLRIGDLLYSLSDDELKVNVLTDPSQELASLIFGEPPPPPVIWVDPPVLRGGPVTIDPIATTVIVTASGTASVGP